MPKRKRRKGPVPSRTAADAEQLADDTVGKMDERFFKELEQRSRRKFCDESRARIKSAVWNWVVMEIDRETKDYAWLEERKDAVRKAASALKDALRVLPTVDQIVMAKRLGWINSGPGLQPISTHAGHVGDLLAGLDRVAEAPPYGVHYLTSLECLFALLFDAYVAAGNKPTLSKSGPFYRLLTKVFEVLPRTYKRRASPEAFAAEAIRMGPRLRAGLSRTMDPLT